jgi:hypothetical protein
MVQPELPENLTGSTPGAPGSTWQWMIPTRTTTARRPQAPRCSASRTTRWVVTSAATAPATSRAISRGSERHRQAADPVEHVPTLGSADGAGSPWVSPVFYVAQGHAQFTSLRPEVSIVIFDSQARLAHAQAVYLSARAEEVAGGDLQAGVQAFSRGSERWGASEWTLEHRPPAVHRLYRATASAYSVLDSIGHPRSGDRRIPVNLDDHRSAAIS